jgi:transcription elongation factor Elf1
MYQCFHCLSDSVVWQSDYNFEDFGYEGEGIVQVLHCSNCGAEIEYKIPLEDEEEQEANL